MSNVPDPPDRILKTLEANDRNRVLNKSALHPKLQADCEKPPEVLMEVLDELDAALKAKDKRK